MISTRYAKANNPYVPEYDANNPKNYLLYLDCTNLYRTAMTQQLPIDDIRWLEGNEIEVLDVHVLRDDSASGYILEVDLGYPHHIHDLHSNLPLAPEEHDISDDMLSSYCFRMKMPKDFACSTEKVEKLIMSLTDKTAYIVHYRTLKLYLELGMELKAVYSVLSFRQCAWLKHFIDFNLFMKHPEDYDQNDLAAYKSILQETNAHKHYYLPGARINTNKSIKYKEVIANLFASLTGRGTDYVHWEDPNELVDRLRLLMSSQQAGHTGRDNEIISILEDLRETNIIR